MSDHGQSVAAALVAAMEGLRETKPDAFASMVTQLAARRRLPAGLSPDEAWQRLRQEVRT